MISGGNLSNCLSISISSKLRQLSRNYYKVLITLTVSCPVSLLVSPNEIFKADLAHLQNRHLCANCKLHAHGNEAANCERLPITILRVRWEKLKRDQPEYSCLLFLNDVLSPSLYMLIQLFSSISVNSGF